MTFRVFVEPQQGATYGDQLECATAAEDLGYDGFFRSDHYLAVGGALGEPGPTDSWVTLAGLARETRRLRLGTLVSSATFRHPGQLAIQVAQVDEMSDGRVELGIGTGWYEEEHRAYGIPFPRARFDRLEEQLRIVRGLWETPAGERFDFTGEHHTLVGAPALPKPRQRRVPVIVGGRGPVRTPALAARYADEINIGFVRPDVAAEQYARVAAACAQQGRDATEVVRSVALVVCCGTSDAQVAQRAHRMERGVAELRATGLTGTPSQVAERIAAYRAVGVQRFYLQFLDMRDLDHVEIVAQQVLPQVPAD
ncbi:LLM class F420-dependent oxidoreductase [Cellulomonas phragmiteti]|uniref:LLM class F420-dependent oxidoreductase n=1 Tax=Cellulomonas phragmiteti TaxID=478780 RepID=A0ABQ4DS82_9CELL|nr:LLM class F420-dependent oxidoreductase [Cellulomonas phragmiteti]GIG41857.1 LLM class F420-dependent oxidoreductase [Cellulomonas phragmiteti]